MTSNGQTIPFGSASDWIGLAAGDIDGQLGDELIAARNYDHTIFVFNWGTQWFSAHLDGHCQRFRHRRRRHQW
ncbi:MAG: hypothetical protein IPI07_06270 [Flavobacteriales bacterium]|nr:hypothetical protein [Flavobacteriales bacterium]